MWTSISHEGVICVELLVLISIIVLNMQIASNMNCVWKRLTDMSAVTWERIVLFQWFLAVGTSNSLNLAFLNHLAKMKTDFDPIT